MTELSFGSPFPREFFNSALKKSITANFDISKAVLDSRTKMEALVRGAGLSKPAADLCSSCFVSAPDEFFYMPTASTGKYHGGPESAENSVGGNIVHTTNVLKMAPKVLHRYEKALGAMALELSIALKVACILHDIYKYRPGGLFTDSTHGELGADLIRSVGADSNYSRVGWVAEAVQNHMYCWRFDTVWDSIISFSGSDCNALLLSFMLSECDYYGSIYND